MQQLLEFFGVSLAKLTWQRWDNVPGLSRDICHPPSLKGHFLANGPDGELASGGAGISRSACPTQTCSVT